MSAVRNKCMNKSNFVKTLECISLILISNANVFNEQIMSIFHRLKIVLIVIDPSKVLF